MKSIVVIKIQPKYFSKGDIILDYSPILPGSEPYEVVEVYNHNIHLKGINNKKNLQVERTSNVYWYSIEINNGGLG